MGEGNGKAGDEDRFGEEGGGLSLGRMTECRHNISYGVTSDVHSASLLGKTRA